MNDTIVPLVKLPSQADFNHLEECESDSDCSDVDSTDFDSEELVNGKPVTTVLEDKSIFLCGRKMVSRDIKVN